MDNSNNTNSNSSQVSNAWQEYLDKHFKSDGKGETIKDVKMSNIPKENTMTNKSQEKKHTHPFIIILLLILIIGFVVNTFEIYDLKQQIDGLTEWIDSIDNRTSFQKSQNVSSWENLKNKKEYEESVKNQSSSSWKEYKKQQESREQQENINQEVETMVWVGDTGTKYHKQSCRTLKENGHQITMEQALSEGRQACKVCY